MGTTKSGLTVTSGTVITSAWGNNTRDGSLTYETSAPTLTQEGAHYVRTDLNTLVRYTGSAHETYDGYGGFTSYTPTFSSSLFTVGNAVVSGGYRYVGGRAVVFWAILTWGSTTSWSAMGGGSMSVTVPVNMASHWTYFASDTMGCTFADASNVTYKGVALYSSATTLTLGLLPTAGTHLYRDLLLYNSPVTWTTNDSWTVAGWYEAAS